MEENNLWYNAMIDEKWHKMDPTQILGKDAKKFMHACYKIFRECMDSYGKTISEKNFRIVYGIAKRHGLYVQWEGAPGSAFEPDRYTIFKKNEVIARIGF